MSTLIFRGPDRQQVIIRTVYLPGTPARFPIYLAEIVDERRDWIRSAVGNEEGLTALLEVIFRGRMKTVHG